MSIQRIAWAFGLRDISPLAKLLAIKIADNPPGRFTSLKELAVFANTTEQEIKRALDELEQNSGVTIWGADPNLEFIILL